METAAGRSIPRMQEAHAQDWNSSRKIGSVLSNVGEEELRSECGKLEVYSWEM